MAFSLFSTTYAMVDFSNALINIYLLMLFAITSACWAIVRLSVHLLGSLGSFAELYAFHSIQLVLFTIALLV